MFKPMYQKIRKYMDEQGVSRKQVALSMKVSESKLSLILSRHSAAERLDLEGILEIDRQTRAKTRELL